MAPSTLDRLRWHFKRNEMSHEPLRDPRSIRLLTLLPGNFKDPIQCNFEIVCLDDGPIYEALSYALGSPHKVHWVRCEKKRMYVTQSLQEALIRLRHKSDKRVIWIDQLCVNQLDLDERSQQVSMMGDIYSEARRVVVWLGQEDSETQLVWDFVEKIHVLGDCIGKESVPSAFEILFPDKPPPLALTTDLPLIESKYWQALRNFLQNRDWFRRSWAFQEIIVSQDCAMQCGNLQITWAELERAICFILQAGQAFHLEYETKNILSVLEIRTSWNHGELTSLSRLLPRTRYLEASDPRDKVFALQALTDVGFPADYLKPVEKIYTDVVKACIVQENSLDILNSVEIRDDETIDLPPWVTDWRNKSTFTFNVTSQAFNITSQAACEYDASGSLAPVLLDKGDSNVLGLLGFRVAQVSRHWNIAAALGLSKGLSRDFAKDQQGNELRWQYENWNQTFMGETEAMELPSFRDGLEVGGDVFVEPCILQESEDRISKVRAQVHLLRRTISAGCHPAYAPWADEDRHLSATQYKLWKDEGFPVPIPPIVLHEYDLFVSNMMNNRRLFVAYEGSNAYIGIAPRTIRGGDFVCILPGGTTPFILRESGSNWRSIGNCYVDGIMFGEEMERTKEEGFEYEEFTLI